MNDEPIPIESFLRGFREYVDTLATSVLAFCEFAAQSDVLSAILVESAPLNPDGTPRG